MAAADLKKTEFGYVLGGTGTDATTISTDKLWVKCIAFAGNADNATAALTVVVGDGLNTPISCAKFKTNGNDLDAAGNKLFFGDKGVPMTGLAATLSHADDRLYIYLKF